MRPLGLELVGDVPVSGVGPPCMHAAPGTHPNIPPHRGDASRPGQTIMERELLERQEEARQAAELARAETRKVRDEGLWRPPAAEPPWCTCCRHHSRVVPQCPTSVDVDMCGSRGGIPTVRFPMLPSLQVETKEILAHRLEVEAAEEASAKVGGLLWA